MASTDSIQDYYQTLQEAQKASDYPTFLQAFQNLLEWYAPQIPLTYKALQANLDALESSSEFKELFQGYLEIYQEAIFLGTSRQDLKDLIIQHLFSKDILLTFYPETLLYEENPFAQNLEELIQKIYPSLDKTSIPWKEAFQTLKKAPTDFKSPELFQQVLKIFQQFFPVSVHFPLSKPEISLEMSQYLLSGADHFLKKFIQGGLTQKGIISLDPLANSGGLLVSLINYLAPNTLKSKFSEIFANELALWPFYISQIRVEEAYFQKTQQKQAFTQLSQIDTLDRLPPSALGKQTRLFTSQTPGLNRLQKQFNSSISFILSDLSQVLLTKKNATQAYEFINQRLKATYGKASPKSSAKLYQPLAQFIRWASDRLASPGIILLIFPQIYLEMPYLDGLRKLLREEFQEIYFIHFTDASSPEKLVALYLIKENRSSNKLAPIYYTHLGEPLSDFAQLNFNPLAPDRDQNWINPSNDDFQAFIPLMDKEVKAARDESAIFKFFFPGLKINYEEWLLDRDANRLHQKAEFFFNVYNFERRRWQDSKLRSFEDNFFNDDIKWSSDLMRKVQQNLVLEFRTSQVQPFNNRPFQMAYGYLDKNLLGKSPGNFPFLMPPRGENKMLVLSGIPSKKAFQVIASSYLGSQDLLDKAYFLPFYRYDEAGQAYPNITDWGLEQFRAYYEPPWQEQAESNRYYLKALLNFSDFENCQVSPELAQEIRRLIQLEEQPQMIRHLFNSINQPDQKTEEQFKRIAQTFNQVRKVFDRTGKRAARSQESFDILADYFEAGQEALESLQNYFSGESGQNPFASHFHLERSIQKADIFYYAYAVLHHPRYLEKYAFNLQREYPRIPFYKNFWQWVAWGNSLWNGHSLQERVEPWPLKIEVFSLENPQNHFSYKIYRAQQEILIQDQGEGISIQNIPPTSWDYKIYHRSAIEWVLESYKAPKNKASASAEKIPPYHFQDYKAQCIRQIQQIVRISQDTLRIQQDMNLEEN